MIVTTDTNYPQAEPLPLADRITNLAESLLRMRHPDVDSLFLIVDGWEVKGHTSTTVLFGVMIREPLGHCVFDVQLEFDLVTNMIKSVHWLKGGK